jgi:[ribosomal protein S5]-alanine N-acetyltransferase
MTGFVQIVHLDLATLQALSAGDLASANRRSPVQLDSFFVGPECLPTWRMRAEQVAATPEDQPWVTGIVLANGVPVGRAGFHAAPDTAGMVEVGYAIEPQYRRRGHAHAALALMLERASQDSTIRRVVASVRPDNEASLGLIAQFDFVRVGEQWDDEDGLEWVFDLWTAGR